MPRNETLMSLRNVVLFSLLSCCCGCASIIVHDDIASYANPLTEFRHVDDPRGGPACYASEGTAVQPSQSGISREYQFENILAGAEPRIMVLQLSNSCAFLTETIALADPTAQARLLVSPNRMLTPEQYFQSVFPYIPSTEHGPHTLILQFTGGQVYQIQSIAPDGTPKWSVASLNVDLPWHERRKSKVYLKRLQYLYTVPFDIIFSPIEFLVWVSAM
jgi:hypothetical protein